MREEGSSRNPLTNTRAGASRGYSTTLGCTMPHIAWLHTGWPPYPTQRLAARRNSDMQTGRVMMHAMYCLQVWGVWRMWGQCKGLKTA